MESLGTVWVDVMPNLSACKQATFEEVLKVLCAHVYGDSGPYANPTGERSLCSRMADDLVARFVIMPRATAEFVTAKEVPETISRKQEVGRGGQTI